MAELIDILSLTSVAVALLLYWVVRIKNNELRTRNFLLQVENEKLIAQRDLWHRVADLPDAEEHRPTLTNAELERRNDIIDDVIDAHNL